MSAAKMMADSTQGDLDEPRKKRKKKKESEKRKSKKMKKEKESKRSKKVQKEDEDSDLDLEKDLHSIGDYIRERQEMNEQLFHCLRGPTLQRYVPDVLKELSLEELKRRCLEHLEIMSKKRIRRILSGDDPSTISSSGTEEASSSEEETPQDLEEQACLDEGTAEIEGEEKSEDDEASMDERGEKSDDGACPDEDEEMPDDDDKSEEDDSREDKSSVIAESSSEEGEISEDSDGGDTVSDTDVKPGPEKSDSEIEEGAVTSDEETQKDAGGDKSVHSATDEGRKLDDFVASGHKGGDEKSENDGDDGFKGSVMADNNAENLIHGKLDQDSNNREGTSTETDYLRDGKGGSSEVHKMDVEEGEESDTNDVCCETRSRLSEENDKVKAEHVPECQGQLESSEKGHNAPNKFDEDESQDPGEQQNLKINNEHYFTIVENDRATDIIMEDIRSSETKRNEIGSEQEVQNKGESQQSTQDEEAIDEGEISVLEDSEKQLSVITSDHAKKDDDVISLGDEDVSVLDLPPGETSAPLASSGLDKSVPIIVDHDTSTEDGKCDKLESSEISEKDGDCEAKNSDKRKVEFVGQREVTLSTQCNMVVKLDKTVSEASSTRKVSLQERLGNKVTTSASSKTSTRLVIKTSPDSSGKSRKVSVDASSNVTTVSSTSKIMKEKSSSSKPSKEAGVSVAIKPSSSKLCHTVTIAKGQMVKLQHGKTVESKTISLKTLGGIKTASSSKPTTSSSSSFKPSSSSSKQSTNSSKPSTSAAKPSKSSSKPSAGLNKPSTSLAKPSTSSSIKSTKTLKTSAASSQVIESGPDDQAGLSKNQMELLELEMRARAIKSMLAAHEKTELQK